MQWRDPHYLQPALRQHTAVRWRTAGPPVTSAGDGTVTVTPVEGRNQLLAIIRMPVQGDAKTTQRSDECLFAFQTH